MEEKSVLIDSPFITLDQLFKEEGIIPTGGAAKRFLKENTVLVNDEPDDRQGHKLYPGGKIQIPDHQLLVIKDKQG